MSYKSGETSFLNCHKSEIKPDSYTSIQNFPVKLTTI